MRAQTARGLSCCDAISAVEAEMGCAVVIPELVARYRCR